MENTTQHQDETSFREVPLIDKKEENSLAYFLDQIPDFRGKFGKRFSLTSLLCLIIWGFMSGCASMRQIAEMARNYDQANEDKLSQALGLRHGTPSHHTLSRVMRQIDQEQLNLAFLRWMDCSLRTRGFHLAIDGKAVRASKESCKGQTYPPYLLNVFETDSGKCVAQLEIEQKSNEISMVPTLINLLNEKFPGLIQGFTISTDALSCHESTFKAVEAAGASYVSPVKNNERELKEYISLFMEDFIKQAQAEAESHTPPRYQSALNRLMGFSTIDDKGNRLDRRTYWGVNLREEEHHPKFYQIGLFCLVERERIENPNRENRKSSQTKTCYQSTAPMDITEMAGTIRGHWKSETSHFYLDIDMDEDKSTAKKEAALPNLGLMRKAALNLLLDADKAAGTNCLKSTQTYFIYHPIEALNMMFKAIA